MISRRTKIAAAFALAVAVAVRVLNAFEYNLLWGFDAQFNWRYIQYLQETWALPHPESLWSAAHPPFFYYASAVVVRTLGDIGRDGAIVLLRLIGTGFGLATVALAYGLVRRRAPDSPRRALLAAGLLLFLPVHIYMSAMLTEEIVVTFLVSLTLVGLVHERPSRTEGAAAYAPFALGAIAGIAFLTKLTGVLVAVAATIAYLVDGHRARALRPACARAAIFLATFLAIGSWFYIRSLVKYGYLYPFGLEIHQVMFTMQPGERHFVDYFYLPLAIFTDPQVLNHDLVRSIWGSTYVTLWFDGHRAFLPHSVSAVDRIGGVLLTLGLVPTAAFAIGCARGGVRALRERCHLDVVFLSAIALTLAGYALFTWRNPFFAVLKASFLLSLSVPFAWYASEVLDEWIGRGGSYGAAVATSLATGALLVAVTFSHTRWFWNMDHMDKPGMVWATWDPKTGRIEHR